MQDIDTKTEPQAEAFSAKAAILRGAFHELTVADYASLLYGCEADEKPFLYILHEEGRIGTAYGIYNLLEVAQGRKDIATPLCTFSEGATPRKSAIERFYGFTVDLDDCTVSDTARIMGRIKRGEIPRPTAIKNTGHGLHMVYAVYPVKVIDERATRAESRAKGGRILAELEKVYSLLKNVYKNQDATYRVDGLHIAQPFRVNGSQTKQGQTVRAYRSGGRWTISGLAHQLGHEWSGKPSTPTQRRATSKDYQSGKLRAFPIVPYAQAVRWWESTKKRVLSEVEEGHRYTAMLAMIIRTVYGGWV